MQYALTFMAVFVTDLIYVRLVKCIHNHKVLGSCVWSTMLTLTTALTVISYTADHWALIPALLGAFAGTYAGMRGKQCAQSEH